MRRDASRRVASRRDASRRDASRRDASRRDASRRFSHLFWPLMVAWLLHAEPVAIMFTWIVEIDGPSSHQKVTRALFVEIHGNDLHLVKAAFDRFDQ